MKPGIEFDCGPDAMRADIRHYVSPDEKGHSAFISFSGRGPRGGYVYGPSTLDCAAMIKLSALIDEAMGWPFRCTSCGRVESDCSAAPCPAVISDRET